MLSDTASLTSMILILKRSFLPTAVRNSFSRFKRSPRGMIKNVLFVTIRATIKSLLLPLYQTAEFLNDDHDGNNMIFCLT